tara:strand:+ start:210 stop:428 length:219 start_codon:yes stop_codon:yes gene_type:complete
MVTINANPFLVYGNRLKSSLNIAEQLAWSHFLMQFSENDNRRIIRDTNTSNLKNGVKIYSISTLRERVLVNR